MKKTGKVRGEKEELYTETSREKKEEISPHIGILELTRKRKRIS